MKVIHAHLFCLSRRYQFALAALLMTCFCNVQAGFLDKLTNKLEQEVNKATDKAADNTIKSAKDAINQNNKPVSKPQAQKKSKSPQPAKTTAGTDSTGSVTGTLRSLNSSRQYKSIPDKKQPGLKRVRVVRVVLTDVQNKGNDSSRCKIYYSVIDTTGGGVIDEPASFRKMRSKIAAGKYEKVTLKDVAILNAQQRECTFDHYRTFNIARPTKKKPNAAQKEYERNAKVTEHNKKHSREKIGVRGMTLKGVELCGTLEKAKALLKKQGYLKGQSDSAVTESIKKNGTIVGRKVESGAVISFLVQSSSGGTIVDTVVYKAKGLKDVETPFIEAKKHIEKTSGVRLGCFEKHDSKDCHWNKPYFLAQAGRTVKPGKKSRFITKIVGTCPP